METVDLTDLIAPSFYKVHWDIMDGKHTYYDLYGGGGSTKSSFISVEIVLGIMDDPAANAAVFRKYAVTLRESVYEQIQWAIDSLGVAEYWEAKVSPLCFVYKRTGQKIIFRGLDKAKKTKSIKASHGYFKYLWFEELDEFAGMEEIRTVQQSILRGGQVFVVFKSFDPPITTANWANRYVNEPKDDSYRHKSDYTTVPAEWLGQQFIDDAEHLKKTNLKAYQHKKDPAVQADYDELSYKWTEQNKAYNEFCEQSGLKPQYERIKMASFTRTQEQAANEAAGRYTAAKKAAKSAQNSASDGEIKLNEATKTGTIKEKVESGEYSLKLSRQMYLKHVEGTAQFNDYAASRKAKNKPSQNKLTISEEEAQQIIERYHGKGKQKKTKGIQNIEYVTTDTIIGKYLDENGWHDTRRAAIHYGKRASHIVPVEEKRND